MVRVTGKLAESEMFVERTRLVVFGVNGKSSDTRDVRSLKRPQHRIFQQARSKALALPSDRNRQPGQEHDRYRVPRQPLLQPFRRICVFHLADN